MAATPIATPPPTSAPRVQVRVLSFAEQAKFALKNSQGVDVLVPLDRGSPKPLLEGGFSSLARAPGPAEGVVGKAATPSDFFTVSDRGANLEITGRSNGGFTYPKTARFFPLPSYSQSITKVRVDGSATKPSFSIVERIALRREGVPVNGLPTDYAPRATAGEFAFDTLAATKSTAPLKGNAASYDFEGIAVDKAADGKLQFWLSDEYGPVIVRVDERGNILDEAFSSTHRAASATKNRVGTADAPNVNEHATLPRILRHRKDNRGFEGLTSQGDFVYAVLQSPLDSKGGASGEKGHDNKKTPLHRFLRIDKKTFEATMFAYAHDPDGMIGKTKHDNVKIGDITALTEPGAFLVYEHDGENWGRLYRARITPRTTKLPDTIAPEAGTFPYTALEKTLVADVRGALSAAGAVVPEKLEGLTVTGKRTVMLAFDNDYCFGTDKSGAISASDETACSNIVVELTLPADIE